MALTDKNAARPGSGWEGDVAGMGLADVIQVNSRNRFSGSVRVSNGASAGVLFFHDGNVVHAEQGAWSGEDAVVEILRWGEGRFSVEQNVVTARRTIDKSCEHLLLDAHRQLDERKATGQGAPPTAPAAPAPAAGRQPTALAETIRAVADVEDAVLITGDGQSLGASGPASEVLAGQAAYLVMCCDEFGALFQCGEVRSAEVEGSDRHLLLYASKARRYLAVTSRSDADLRVVDAAVRAVLTKGR